MRDPSIKPRCLHLPDEMERRSFLGSDRRAGSARSLTSEVPIKHSQTEMLIHNQIRTRWSQNGTIPEIRRGKRL